MDGDRPPRPPAEATGQLRLSGPLAEHWWCDEGGTTAGVSRVFVVADDREEADAPLRDLGVLPGGRPGLHESFLRMCESARRGAR